jgi:hypothetical protein
MPGVNGFMKPGTWRKKTIYLLIIAFLFCTVNIGAVFADPTVLQPPLKHRVSDIGYVKNVYTSDWYAKLEWEAAVFPPEAQERYISLELSEVENGTGNLIHDAIVVPLPGGSTSFELNEYSPAGIKPGTIYFSNVRCWYRNEHSTGQYTVTSPKSNPAKFLTGLDVSLDLIPGTNNIKIKWNDVWDTSGRINYRILISDTKGFTQPPPIPDILGTEIGTEQSAVTVNREEKMLEYIYPYALPGREYSIKVVPLPNKEVACVDAEEIEPITIKTDILLKAQRVGYNDQGDVIWKLFWNPIVKGSTFTRVDYELYRYINNEPQGKLFRLIPDQDSYQFVVKKDDPNLYSFKIDAKAYVQGSPTPIEFRSNNRVMLKEQIPQKPEAPDIVGGFPEADPPIFSDELLTATEATVLWRVPYTGEGLIDNEITYDIYLLDDIRDVNNPPSNKKIAADITLDQTDKVTNSAGQVIGCRYDLEGLKSNMTYYFVIYAKKSFLVQNPGDNFMITMPYISSPGIKVIITKPDTGTDRPIAPSSPPFRLENGMESISYTTATMAMDKKWYAFYNSSTQRWDFTTYDKYIENQLLDPDDPEKQRGAEIKYMAGWTIVPHAVKYNDALTAIRLRNNREEEYITYSDLMQPDILAFDIPQQTVVVPDIGEDEDQSFSFDITGLEPNNTYIVWITIKNQNGSSSDPSDPIIITTPPQIPEIPVTPTVPDDLKGIAGDTFVDLFWTYKKDMDYEIKGGTTDSINSAAITYQVSYEEIKSKNFIRIDNLEADTVYYFWIKAVNRSNNADIESEYSNPLVIKTEAYTPPAPPTGFGVKTPDGVTENSITYLWDDKEGFSYLLEFADNAEFNGVVIIEAGGGIHTVHDLISNRRYYARLYAVDNKTGLRSVPTRTIMVVTNKSRSEYDGSYDLSQPETGNGLDMPVKLENGKWIVSSLDDNAHLLAQRIRGISGPIVMLDLSNPPERTNIIRLDLGAPVIETLSGLKKELCVKLPWCWFKILPGTFETDAYYKYLSRNTNPGISFEVESPAEIHEPSSMMRIITPVTDFNVTYLNENKMADGFQNPVGIGFSIPGLARYYRNEIKVYSKNFRLNWYAVPTGINYDTEQVEGEINAPGPVVAAAWGVESPSGMPVYVKNSLEQIQKIFVLKSLEGKAFNYGENITQENALKLIFDVIPSEYTHWDIKDKALNAGIIKSFEDIGQGFTRRDKALYLLASLYKFKTKESIVPQKPAVWSRFQDLKNAENYTLEACKFALENGIVIGDGSNFYPDRLINYGDFIVLLERTLRLCGEL